MDPSDRPEPPDPVRPGNGGDEPPDEKGLVEEVREGVEHVVEEVREGVEHVVEEVREGVEQVVEEVREEVEELHERIEEAVEEHLPRRARYRAGRIAWLILGSFVALIALGIGGGLVYLGRHSEQVAGELTRVLNQALAQHSDLVLEVRDLEGNPFQQVRLIRPRLRLRGSDRPPLLEAPSMTVAYTPWSLWLGRRRSIAITLDRPFLRFTRGPDGHLVLPAWRPGPAKRGGGPELEILIHLRDGTVRTPDTTLDVVGLDLDGRALTGRNAQVTVQHMTWTHGPYGSELQGFAGELSVSDSVRIRVTELRTPDVTLRARGAWRARRPGEGPHTLRLVHLDVDHVRWRWLARLFGNPAFDVAGGASGAVEARGNGDWRGTVAAAAVWDSVPMNGQGRFAWSRGTLRVDPLGLSSPIGELSGRVAYAADHWEVGGDVRHGDPARWRILGLRGWPGGDLGGRMTYRSRREGQGHASHLEATLSPSTLGGWRADTARTLVDWPAAGPDSFAVQMVRRGGRFALEGRTGAGGWVGRYEIARYPLDEWEEGRKSGIHGVLASGTGTVEGRPEGVQVSGALEGVASDWLGLHAAHWRLDELGGRLLPTLDLGLKASLRDGVFLGVHFDSAFAQLRLGDRRLALDSVRAEAGDTTLTAGGRSTWDPGGWRVTLERARARSRQFDWTAEGPVELAGDPKGVAFDRLVARDQAARLELKGRWAGPGGQYDWTARGERLDLARLGFPPTWGLAGAADAVLRVDGPASDPHWRFEGGADSPAMGGHGLDRLDLVLEGRRSEVQVRSLSARLENGRLEGRLSFASLTSPWPDTLTAGGVRTWLFGSRRWEGEFSADSLPLGHLENFSSSARGFSGRLTGHGTLGGDPHRPEVAVAAAARPLRWDSLAADQARVRASYRDGRLEVPELSLFRGEARSTLTGSMPLRLDLARRPEVPDEPMTWRIEIERGDVGLVPYLVPQIAQARGRIDVSASVAGTAGHPTLDGSISVRDGVLVPTGREEVLENIYADFRLARSRVTLDTLFAREGRRGAVTGHGAVNLEGGALKDYRFDLALRDFTVIESGFYVAQVNGRVAVADGPRLNGHTLPMISGDVTLDRGVVVFDFGNAADQERLAATTQPLLWTYRIHLLANNNLRWQPPDADIEFSADLTLEQTPGALAIYGDMHGLRGTYDFLSNRFTVRKADLTFDNVGGINPIIDAEATTRVTPTQAPSEPSYGTTVEQAKPHVVTVKIAGRADRPDIAFTTDKDDWDEARVLRELTVGRFFEGGNVALGDPLDNYLTRKLNAQLDPLLSKAFLGYVNQWSLAREQGGVFYGQGELFLKVSSQVSPQFLVSYTQKLPGFARPYSPTYTPIENAFERNVEAEYRINRFFYITTGFAQRRSPSTSLTPGPATPEFDVNLKARWEY